MPAVQLTPFTKSQWFSSGGDPLAGGKLFSFSAGTSTPLATYTDSTGSVPNPNPVVLDAAGRADVWLSAGTAYKLTMQDSSGVVLWTEDNVNPALIPANLADTNIAGNLAITQPTAATVGANQSSKVFEVDANYWNGSASATDKWTFQDVLGAGTNPAATLTVQHTGSSGAASVSLPNVALTGVASLTTGTVTAKTNVTLQKADGTLPATIANDTTGGISFSTNAGKTWVIGNTGNLNSPGGNAIVLQGGTSGFVALNPPSVAGSSQLTFPAATGNVVLDSATQTLTNKIATTLGITGGATNANLRFNSSAQIVNGNTTDDGTNFSTGTVKLQAQNGVTQGSGMKHQRFGATNATAAAAGATATTAYTWTSAFADANYTVIVVGSTQTNTPAISVESITAAGFTVRVTAITAAVSSYAGVEAFAIHD